MDNYDALFVINQDCNLKMICRLCNSKQYGNVFFLTTHALLDNELAFLHQHLPVMPKISTFSSLLTDADMEKCDDDATKTLKQAHCTDNRILDSYVDRFIKRSVENKNQLVRNRLMSERNFNHIYYCIGLGVVPEVWKIGGGRQLVSNKYDVFSITDKIVGKIHSLYSKNEFHEVVGAEGNFMFLSSVRRLRFNNRAEHIGFPTLKNLLWNFGNPSKLCLAKVFLSKREKTRDNKYKIATTIHEYQSWMSRLGRELYVFVDGFHPENYPRTYIDGFNNCVFVSRNMFDIRWFEKFGMRCLPSCSFIQPEYFNKVDRVKPIRTIVLLLNHAGDWSALINRSDTDLLIRWFAKCASLHPAIRFIIRPHPTMIHPRHEGCNSIERICCFVKWCALQNLEVSSASLNEDIDRGDIFLSEYSQTLLDVYRNGLPGLIVNCTNRRSFMADYEALGFPATGYIDRSVDVLKKVIECPDDHILTQNMAVSRYNKALEAYLSERTHGDK